MGNHDMLTSFGDATHAANVSKRRSASSMNLPTDQNCSWEMIGLGLEEALPPQDMINDLYV